MQSRPQTTLLYMTVDIGDGRQDVLQITPDDDAVNLAQKFAMKHKLNKDMTSKLRTLIRSNQMAARRYQDEQQPATTSTWQGLSRSQVSESTLTSTRKARRPPSLHEDREVTFHPKVNSPVRRTYKPEDMLLQKGKELQDRREEIRNYYISEELKDCTFQPQIDHRSLKLSSRTMYSSPRHEMLYQDAQVRQEQKRETYLYTVKTEFPYHPQINERQESETREQVFTRLTQAKRRTSSDSIPEQNTEETDVYFHPLTGRGPTIPEYMRKQPVHEHLYELRDHKHQVTEHLRSQLHEQRPNYTSFTTKKSDQIVRLNRRRQFEKIFQQLDADRDGVINFETLNIDGVDERVLRLLGPVWEVMQEKEAQLDLERFVNEAEAVWMVLSVEEKDYLLKANTKPRVQPAQLESKPRLNQISRILAAERFAEADVYTKQLQDKELAAQKTAQLKAALLEQEMAQCTFRPETTKYTRK